MLVLQLLLEFDLNLMRFLEGVLKRFMFSFQCLENGGDFIDWWTFGEKVWNVENKFKAKTFTQKEQGAEPKSMTETYLG
jgi:hypothetical protein